MRLLLATLGLVLAWSALVLVAGLEGWGRAPLAPRGDLAAFADAAEARIREGGAGNAVLVLLRDGEVAHDFAFSVGEPVDRKSLFQVASLSKWVSAWGVMALVEEGRLGLDVPVSRYLTRWELPASEFDTSGVTVRRLLSHTAGLADGLGYQGFAPDEPVQTLEESLTRAADAMPHAGGAVRVGREPGSGWQYSGGGYTLLQLLVEEVTGEPFEAYMQRAVLDPLHMRRSTFDWRRAEESGLVAFYDVDLAPALHYRFTALAAASLYTSASDLVRFLRAHLPGPDEEPVGRGVLAPGTVERMRTPQATRLGRPIWGLGTILYARNGRGGFVIGHDGRNAPAINTAARLDPATGHGIVVLETGSPDLASTLASEWVFWETGNVDVLLLVQDLGRMLWTAAGGALAILLGALVLLARRRARAQRG